MSPQSSICSAAVFRLDNALRTVHYLRGAKRAAIWTLNSSPATPSAWVLVGLPAGSRTTLERYAARGYDVLAVDVDEAAGVEGSLASVGWGMDALREHATDGKIAVVGYGLWRAGMRFWR